MRESGQTLIEVLAGLAAAVVVIAAITVATLTSLTNAEFTRNQSTATQYALQGVEIMRNMRNSSIASVSTGSLPDSTYCLAKSCTKLSSGTVSCWQKNIDCGQNVDAFKREVVINHSASTCDYTNTGDVQVKVNVSWYDGKCTGAANQFCHTVTLTSCLSDFTVAPTP